MNDSPDITIDPATGFLEKNEKFIFGAKGKTLFLKALKRHGNQTAAADESGVPYETVEEHLRIDLTFHRAFRATLLEMRHTIEGKFYVAALRGEASEAKMWLQAFFPETYRPSAGNSKQKPTTDPLDALYKKL